jgi:hypothetical protein
MNTQGNEIFESDFMKNCAFNGWFSKPEDEKNLEFFDFNKHYISCLMGQDVKYGWSVYSIFDEIEPFGGIITHGVYFVITQNIKPFRGNGFYDADLVQYALDENIIKLSDITLQYIPSKP